MRRRRYSLLRTVLHRPLDRYSMGALLRLWNEMLHEPQTRILFSRRQQQSSDEKGDSGLFEPMNGSHLLTKRLKLTVKCCVCAFLVPIDVSADAFSLRLEDSRASKNVGGFFEDDGRQRLPEFECASRTSRCWSKRQTELISKTQCTRKRIDSHLSGRYGESLSRDERCRNKNRSCGREGNASIRKL